MSKQEISFDVTKDEMRLVHKIVKRAFDLRPDFNNHTDFLSVEMDLCATHANGCPMDFERMAEAENFDLIHDVAGIYNHLDRTTGELTNCFLPRFSKKEA